MKKYVALLLYLILILTFSSAAVVNEDLTQVEDGDISEFAGDISFFSASQAITPYYGDYVLKGSASSTDGNIADLSQNVSQGDQFSVLVKYPNDGAISRIAFGQQGDSGYGSQSAYTLSLQDAADVINLIVMDDGTYNKVSNSQVSDFPNDEWMNVTIDWGSDGTINADIDGVTSGSDIGSLTHTDTNYTSGGTGFNIFDGTVYWDDINSSSDGSNDSTNESENSTVESEACSGSTLEVCFNFNETGSTGPTIDYSGQDNDGVWNGTPETDYSGVSKSQGFWGDGKAYYLNGNDPDTIHFGTPLFDSVEKQYTMSIWFYPTTTNGKETVVSLDSNSGFMGIEWDDEENQPVDNTFKFFAVGNTNAEIFGDKSYSVNEWHHLVLSVDTNNQVATAYVNGDEIGTGTFDNSVQGATGVDQIGGFGGNDAGDGNDFAATGRVDEFKFFREVKTDNEVQNLFDYNSLTPPGDDPPPEEPSKSYEVISSDGFTGTTTGDFYWIGVEQFNDTMILDGDDYDRFTSSSSANQFQHFSTTQPIEDPDINVPDGTMIGCQFTNEAGNYDYRLHVMSSTDGLNWDHEYLMFDGSDDTGIQSWMGSRYHRCQPYNNGTHIVFVFAASNEADTDRSIGAVFTDDPLDESSLQLYNGNPIIDGYSFTNDQEGDPEVNYFPSGYNGNNLFIDFQEYTADTEGSRYRVKGDSLSSLSLVQSGADLFPDMDGSDATGDVDNWPGTPRKMPDGSVVGLASKHQEDTKAGPAWLFPYSAQNFSEKMTTYEDFRLASPHPSYNHEQVYEAFLFDREPEFGQEIWYNYYTVQKSSGSTQGDIHNKTIALSRHHKGVISSRDRYTYSYENESSNWVFNSTDQQKSSGNYTVKLDGVNIQGELKTASTRSGLDSSSYQFVSDGVTFESRGWIKKRVNSTSKESDLNTFELQNQSTEDTTPPSSSDNWTATQNTLH